ncbi:MAG: PHB depolymerase family esterase [Polyangiales bacterium]
MPKAGVNEFPVGGKNRRFHVIPAKAGTGPRPVFVSLTGTVQEETAFARQSGLDRLAEAGWTVLAPVRSCSQEARSCNQLGTDGRIWEPWYDGTTPLTDDAGPDVAFVDAMVRCVATAFPTAKDAIYAGGISAGGTFTNRNLTFNSELFAGGVPASGNWTYGAPPKTPKTMDSAIMIVLWGGPTDTWGQSPPYAGETKATSAYYAKQPNVVTVSCSGTHGHMWPPAATPWIAETLLSFKKGSDPKAFKLKTPPAGLTCVLGEYTDH